MKFLYKVYTHAHIHTDKHMMHECLLPYDSQLVWQKYALLLNQVELLSQLKFHCITIFLIIQSMDNPDHSNNII